MTPEWKSQCFTNYSNYSAGLRIFHIVCGDYYTGHNDYTGRCWTGSFKATDAGKTVYIPSWIVVA
jgi:hypothetical protein